MKTSTTRLCRHHRLRDAYRRQIAQLGPFVEGSLCRVKRPGRKTASWQLTFARAGRTRTVYVPAELVAEVQQWVKEHKRLRELVRKVSTQSRALIRRHVVARQAESRARRRASKTSAACSRA